VSHAVDKATVGGADLTWHVVDTLNYNVNLFHFARAQGNMTSDVLFWAVTVVNCPREMRKEVIGIYGDRQTVIDDGLSKWLTLNKRQNIGRPAIEKGGGPTDFWGGSRR